ncbi:unnamed protein product [Cylicocyclus nassatus]|uniref:Uncharacterized protein n=1 Tax=Cylicocyclus nassatus TaxID=53992 RepID=A0AA36GPU3_CYLNA|nr:unnamed protein product [Cylicocyclus nassatus]
MRSIKLLLFFVVLLSAMAICDALSCAIPTIGGILCDIHCRGDTHNKKSGYCQDGVCRCMKK